MIVPALRAAYFEQYTEAPHTFVWTKATDMILEKIATGPKPSSAGD